jgi:hypothetical protein
VVFNTKPDRGLSSAVEQILVSTVPISTFSFRFVHHAVVSVQESNVVCTMTEKHDEERSVYLQAFDRGLGVNPRVFARSKL